ncbi:MAG: carbon storage regulator [Zetaproteobacteria bacterium]|nr:MAG: carbon storage regulator [Zetaproteobacteria bacterium]
MLILTRRVGEAITVGDQVQIKVLSIKGGQVRLGVDAPQTVHIDREEVYQQRLIEVATGGGGAAGADFNPDEEE